MKFADIKNALDSYFLDTSDHELNTGYLLDQVELWMDNTYPLYAAVHESKSRKIRTIVWQAFEELATECCFDIHYPIYGQNKSMYRPTYQQLKNYLSKYGYTQETLFSGLVEHYEKSRAVYPESL